MKTFYLLLANSAKAALIVAVLFVFSAAQAQEEGEKGKVHVKVIKEVNGETTVIDTVFDCQPGSLEKHIQVITGKDFDKLMGDNMEKVIIQCDSANGDHKIVKLVKKVDVENNGEQKEVKVIIKAGDESIDLGEEGEGNFSFVIATDDEDGKKIEKKIQVIKKEGAKEGEQEFTVIMNDEGGEPGKLKKCIESDECKVMVLKLKSGGKENNEFTFSYVITGVLAPEDKEMLEQSGVEADIKESDKLKAEEFQIYPNPGDGNFKLSFSSTEKGALSVMVYDLQGRTVFEDHQKSFDGNYEKTIDITSEEKGMYFLKITIGNKSLVKKLEISKE